MNKNLKAIIAITSIILAVIGIWFYKNSEKKKELEGIENQNALVAEENKGAEDLLSENTNSVSKENITETENNTILENVTNSNIVTDSKNQNKTELSEKDFDLYADETFDLEKLKAHKLPIILDFGADYCAPCKEMKPILKKLNQEYRGKAIIKICDVMEYPELASGYDVSLIPTQIFINSDGTPFIPENYRELNLMFAKDRNGNIVYTAHVGFLSEENLKAILKEMK